MSEQDLVKQLRARPYSNPSYWMLEAADEIERNRATMETQATLISDMRGEIERLKSAYDGLTPQQYHACLSRLWTALGNPSMDGRDVFTRVADEITGLRAIIAAKLHRRRCNDCGDVDWHADERTPKGPCEKCDSMNTRRMKETT